MLEDTTKFFTSHVFLKANTKIFMLRWLKSIKSK